MLCSGFLLSWLLFPQNMGSRQSGSVAVAHRLSCLVACESSWTRDHTHVSCIGSWILNTEPPEMSQIIIDEITKVHIRGKIIVKSKANLGILRSYYSGNILSIYN